MKNTVWYMNPKVDYFNAALTGLLASGQYSGNSIAWVVNRAKQIAEEAASQMDCGTWVKKEENELEEH